MTIQLTVVGLDRVGMSLGLALAEQKEKLYRCGHDAVSAKIKNAEIVGAFDKTFFRLKEAIREADVVFLSLPVDQIENTLKDMAEELKEGAIVINSSSANTAFIEWAKTILPEGRHFISMIAAGNGDCLRENPAEALLPRADYFRNADVLIPTDYTTHADAVSMVSELTTLVGANARFVDPLEADGILAKTDLLPKLVSSALLLATLDQPGWLDSRRIASSLYAKTTSAVQNFAESEHPGAAVLANRENAIQAINDMLTSLVQIRSLIEEKDQRSLDDMLTELQQNHAEWLDLRTDGDWEKKAREKSDKPTSLLGRMFGTSSRLNKK